MKKTLNIIFIISVFLIAFCSPVALDMKLTRYKLLFIEVAALILFMLWIVNIIRSGCLDLKNNFLAPVIFYLAFFIIMYFVSKDKLVSRNELERSLLAFAIFLPLSEFVGRKNSRIILLFVLLSTIIITFYGYIQRTGGIWIFSVPGYWRVMSTFGNTDFFAAYLVLVIPVVFSMMLIFRKYYRFLSFIAMVLCIVSLYYTESRGAWIGFIISVIFYMYFFIKEKKVKTVFFVSLFVFSVLFFIATKKIWFRGTERLMIWRDTVKMSLKNPFGVGIGAFHIYFPFYAGQDLKDKLPQEQFIVNYAHNEYLEILSETGIIGAGFFIWLFILLCRFLIESKKKYNAGLLKFERFAMIIGLSSGIIAILVHNFFGVNFRFIANWAYTFFFAGLLSYYLSGNERVRVLKITFPYKIILACGAVAGFRLFSLKIIEPFTAHRTVSTEVDFFDKKIKDAQTEAAELRKKVKGSPDDYKSFLRLGWIYAKDIEIKDKDGNKSLNHQMAKKAVEAFLGALKINPNLYGAYNNIGNIYFTIGDRARAVENYKRSIMINPDQIDARMNLALAYYYRGMLKEATDQLKHVLKIDPANSKAIILLKKMVE